MSAIRTFFRHCPSCGRRYEIRLVSKKEISDESETWKIKERVLPQSVRARAKESIMTLDADLGVPESSPRILEVPEIGETKEFRFNYRCKSCGHEWSEERFKTTERPASPDYEGD